MFIGPQAGLATTLLGGLARKGKELRILALPQTRDTRSARAAYRGDLVAR